MTVLDTFFILFKSNADEVEAATRRAQKITDKFGESINDSKDKAKDLGLSFTDLVAAGTAAFASINFAGAIKNEIGNTIDLEVQMGRLAKLTDISATTINAWDTAVQKASGGPAGEFVSWLTNINNQLIAQGRGDQTKNVINTLLELSGKWQGLSESQKQFYAQQYGLTQDILLLLDQGPEKVKAMITQQEKLRDITDEDYQAALRLKKGWVDVGEAIGGAVGKLLTSSSAVPLAVIDFFSGKGYHPELYDNEYKKELEADNKAGHDLRRFLHLEKDDTGSASAPVNTSGGIFLDGKAPPLLPLPGTPAQAMEQQGLDLNDPAVRDTLNHAIGAPRHQQIMQDAADNIANAQNSQFAAMPLPASAANTTVIKIDKVEVHTQATDGESIYNAFENRMTQHIGNAQSNAEDGILY